MKSRVLALMYSGIKNPEKELTDIEIEKIKELISQLNVKCPEKSFHSKLGFSGFCASSENEGKTDFAVSADFCGLVNVWNEDIKDWKTYYDTSGICAYLFTIMNDTLQKHYGGFTFFNYE